MFENYVVFTPINMCAINGFNFNDESRIRAMNVATAHRGPDGTGVYCDPYVSLGHNRLSIIDLATSAGQPMKSGDGRLVITFNGEIYNYRDLRNELEHAYQFHTQSDTEVILAAYQTWGQDCVKKFNGMFAFAIWDAVKKELFLARDQVGIKPLYYFWDGQQFIFSSEIKGILAHESVPRILNQEALAHYLRILYVPEPLTMFRGIWKLPPASTATVKDKNLSIETYWSSAPGNHFSEPRALLAERLATEVDAAVQRQLVSDRPVGLYLSGGIDSSAVLDSMHRLGGIVDTFTVGFDLTDAEGKHKFNQDFLIAQKTAAHYGTRHHEVMVKPEEVPELFEKSVWHMDEPISKPTAVAMMKIAKEAKQSVAVVLGGDGGDELFGGYERYQLSVMSGYYQHLPAAVRDLFSRHGKLKKLNVSAGIERFALFMFQKDAVMKRVLSARAPVFSTSEFFEKKYFSSVNAYSFEEQLMNVDRQSWLVDDSLLLSDKMTMSAGLEARVPLLDRELIAFADRLPLRYKVNSFHTKILFKEAFRGRLPSYLFTEPKRGWYSPGAKWLRRENVGTWAEDLLSPAYYQETAALFRWPEVRDMLSRHQEKKEYNLTMLWAILTFQAWARMYRVRLS